MEKNNWTKANTNKSIFVVDLFCGSTNWNTCTNLPDCVNCFHNKSLCTDTVVLFVVRLSETYKFANLPLGLYSLASTLLAVTHNPNIKMNFALIGLLLTMFLCQVCKFCVFVWTLFNLSSLLLNVSAWAQLFVWTRSVMASRFPAFQFSDAFTFVTSMPANKYAE